jgi:hypothetical protein
MRRDLSKETVAAWRATLLAGLVVALVVWGLLEWLRRTVNAVDEAVEDVWAAGQRLAQNTQAAHLLHTTKRRGQELAERLDSAKEERG